MWSAGVIFTFRVKGGETHSVCTQASRSILRGSLLSLSAGGRCWIFSLWVDHLIPIFWASQERKTTACGYTNEARGGWSGCIWPESYRKQHSGWRGTWMCWPGLSPASPGLPVQTKTVLEIQYKHWIIKLLLRNRVSYCCGHLSVAAWAMGRAARRYNHHYLSFTCLGILDVCVWQLAVKLRWECLCRVAWTTRLQAHWSPLQEFLVPLFLHFILYQFCIDLSRRAATRGHVVTPAQVFMSLCSELR